MFPGIRTRGKDAIREGKGLKENEEGGKRRSLFSSFSLSIPLLSDHKHRCCAAKARSITPSFQQSPPMRAVAVQSVCTRFSETEGAFLLSLSFTGDPTFISPSVSAVFVERMESLQAMSVFGLFIYGILFVQEEGRLALPSEINVASLWFDNNRMFD